MSESVANDTIIKNLENQLQRLIHQSADLEDSKNDMSHDEYESMKKETLEQIGEFTATLDRLNKGDVTLNSRITTMREMIRCAVSNSFNTNEMIRIFGDQSLNEEATQLSSLQTRFQLKKLSESDYQGKKRDLLVHLMSFGYTLSPEDQLFLENETDSDALENVDAGSS